MGSLIILIFTIAFSITSVILSLLTIRRSRKLQYVINDDLTSLDNIKISVKGIKVKKNITEVQMNFGQAIEKMKDGERVCRSGWNGKGIFIELYVPGENSKMTHPYIFIDTTGLQTVNSDAPKDRVPWLASQTDMLSEDWETVD